MGALGLDALLVGLDKFSFRKVRRQFLCRESVSGGRLMATANEKGDWEVFTFEKLDNQVIE